MKLAHGILSLSCTALLAAASLAPAREAHAAGGIGDAYITSDASNIVRAYDGSSGAFLGNHCASVLGSGQLGIHFGTTNGRFLVGSFGGGVDEYDAASGAYIKTYEPTGGTQWAGIYAPNGNVYIGSWNTNDVREYDVNTGAFIRVVCGINGPSDMRIGPNGNLYICSYMNYLVQEVDPTSGAILNIIPQPFGDRTNDLAFMPNGDMWVTVMGSNVCHRYDSSYNYLGFIVGTGWFRPHGIDVHPSNGLVYIVDGVTTQVHVFDPNTLVEVNAAWRSPDPEDKIVDIEFRRFDQPTPTIPTTWSKIKSLTR
jgi:WD40 repeat protein